MVSVFSSALWLSSIGKGNPPTSASASGLFPLWLRAPRFISAALSSHSLPVGRELGAALVWGKESFPQLLLILVPSDSVVAQPPSSFSLVYVVVSLPLLNFCDFDEGRRSSLAMDAHSGNSPEAKCKCLPQSVARTRHSSHPCAQARTPYGVLIYKIPFPFLPT
jgi:hypothetical protein